LTTIGTQIEQWVEKYKAGDRLHQETMATIAALELFKWGESEKILHSLRSDEQMEMKLAVHDKKQPAPDYDRCGNCSALCPHCLERRKPDAPPCDFYQRNEKPPTAPAQEVAALCWICRKRVRYDENRNIAGIILRGEAGYGSVHDGESATLFMCDDCYNLPPTAPAPPSEPHDIPLRARCRKCNHGGLLSEWDYTKTIEDDGLMGNEKTYGWPHCPKCDKGRMR